MERSDLWTSHGGVGVCVEAENIKINGKTTIDMKAGSDIKMEGSSAPRLTSSDNSNYDAPKIDIE